MRRSHDGDSSWSASNSATRFFDSNVAHSYHRTVRAVLRIEFALTKSINSILFRRSFTRRRPVVGLFFFVIDIHTVLVCCSALFFFSQPSSSTLSPTAVPIFRCDLSFGSITAAPRFHYDTGAPPKSPLYQYRQLALFDLAKHTSVLPPLAL